MNHSEAVQAAFDLMAEKLDKREAYYKKLEEFFEKNGYVPVEHSQAWIVWTIKEKRVSWRDQPEVRKRLWKTAKLEVKNALKKS